MGLIVLEVEKFFIEDETIYISHVYFFRFLSILLDKIYIDAYNTKQKGFFDKNREEEQ